MLYSALETYFKLRFKELLDKKTPDSYRVRTHNALSIMNELCNLIEGWQKRRIQMHETVSLCIDECVNLLHKDLWLDFSFYSKDLFISNLYEYKKLLPDSKDKRETIHEISSSIKYTVRRCIHDNTPTYSKSLFNYIQNTISTQGDMDEDKKYVDTMQKFDMAISTLCTELIRLGYSKNHLFLKANNLLEGKTSISKLCSELIEQRKSQYTIIFRMNATNDVVLCKENYGFVENVDEVKTLLQDPDGEIKFNRFLTSSEGILFFKTQVTALDTYAAIKRAKEKLNQLLDELHLGISVKDVTVDKNVVIYIVTSTGVFSYQRNHDYQLDGEYKNDSIMAIRLKNDVDKILNNDNIKTDVKERLQSALRHLRMANDSSDIELRFINYWVALEFIFSSPISNENTFSRIKKHLTNILCYSYVRKNVNHLDFLLHQCGTLSEANHLVDMSDKEWGDLIEHVKECRIQYRLCCMKSHLKNNESIKAYINMHETNLYQHLSRIYMMRNVLIHEAAIRQDIEGATSNLRFYLTFLLNQMLIFFSNADEKMKLSINDFFHHYENGMSVIKSAADRNYVLHISFEDSLIR